MRTQRLVHHGLQQCPYLPGRVARMPLYRQEERLDLDQADASFAHAERRVGYALYHTDCPTCSACRGLRVLVDDFRPTRSQRRVLKRWEALGDRVTIDVGPPACTPERLALYNRHATERGLTEAGDPLDEERYVYWLVRSCLPTLEMAYYLDDRLIGLGILDVGRTATSSVYFYFDPSPEIARLSPGVFSVLNEVRWCRQTGRAHHYLGLYVRACDKLAYKADYYPHEQLHDGDWRRFDRGDRFGSRQGGGEQLDG